MISYACVGARWRLDTALVGRQTGPHRQSRVNEAHALWPFTLEALWNHLDPLHGEGCSWYACHFIHKQIYRTPTQIRALKKPFCVIRKTYIYHGEITAAYWVHSKITNPLPIASVANWDWPCEVFETATRCKQCLIFVRSLWQNMRKSNFFLWLWNME